MNSNFRDAIPLTKEGFLDTDAVMQQLIDKCSGSVKVQLPDGSEGEIFTLHIEPKNENQQALGVSEKTSNHKSCAEMVVELLDEYGVTDRNTAFNKLIGNAKELGLMPEDAKVIRETLTGLGFVLQSTAVEGIRPEAALRKLGNLGSSALVFIQTRDYSLHYGGNMFALHTEHDLYDMNDYLPIQYCGFSVIHCYIRWDDGIDRSPFPRRKSRRKASSTLKRRMYSETEYYKPYQPNPAGNNIRDCVVRAISGALDIEWIEAVELLAAYGKTTINSREVYPNVLRMKGFVHHNAIKQDGRYINGRDFCEEMNRTYHNGERIIAFVRRNHLAAVVPVDSDGNGKTYKFIDSWDCSKKTIGDYWVLPGKTSITMVG